jgi:hypothetical protein
MASVWANEARFTSWRGEYYRHVGPFDLGNGAFDNYMIDLSIVVSLLSLGIEISVGASNNYEDCAMGREGIKLWWGLLDLWWRWVSFSLDLRIGIV